MRSSPSSWDFASASRIGRMPKFSALGPMTRTSGARIPSFIRARSFSACDVYLMNPATGPFERSFVVKVCGTFKLPYVLDVAETLVEVGFLASREVASLVSGLRSMSTALPISMESLTGSRNSLMRSIVDVGDEVDLVFVLSFVLMLMRSDIGVICVDTEELGLCVGSVGCSGGVGWGGSAGCGCIGAGGGGGGGCMPSAW